MFAMYNCGSGGYGSYLWSLVDGKNGLVWINFYDMGDRFGLLGALAFHLA